MTSREALSEIKELEKYMRDNRADDIADMLSQVIPIIEKDLIMKNAIKQANTIEELCDEFIFDGGDDTPLLCTYEELKYWFNHSKEQQYKIRNCYGAIWTDKGLIYVAKMNNDGELELI